MKKRKIIKAGFICVLIFAVLFGIFEFYSQKTSKKIIDNFKFFELKNASFMNVKNPVETVSVSPYNPNTVYFFTSDGSLCSTEDGKTYKVLYKFENAEEPTVPDFRRVWIKPMKGGKVYVFLRKGKKTYVAYSDNGKNNWKISVLNIPAYSVTESKINPEVVYIGTTSFCLHSYSSHLRGVVKLNLKMLYPEDYSFYKGFGFCEPVSVLCSDDKYVYYCLNDFVGLINRRPYRIKSLYESGQSLFLSPDRVKCMAVCKNSKGNDIIFATEKTGIIEKNLSNGEVKALNKVALKYSYGYPFDCPNLPSLSPFEKAVLYRKRVFRVYEDIPLNPVKIITDEKHEIAFLISENNFVFACNPNDENPVWYPILLPEYYRKRLSPPHDWPVPVEGNLSCFELLKKKSFLGLNFRTVFRLDVEIKGIRRHINDATLSYKPYRLILATNSGLAFITFKNLH